MQGEYRDELPKLLESVYKFYCTGKNVNNPQSLADLQAVLEAQHFAFRLGNYREAYNLIPREYLRRWGYWNLSKELYEQILPYVEGELRSYCLGALGAIHRDLGNWDLAEKYFKDALAIAEAEDNKIGIATSLGMLGDIERNRGNWDEAETLDRQSLEMMKELGDRKGIAMSIGCLGENELGRGNLDTAEQLLTEALGKMQKLGMTWHIAEVNYCFARLERSRGNTEVAQQHYDTAHQIFQQLGAAKDLEKIDREWHNSD